jgi:hypothetical protein
MEWGKVSLGDNRSSGYQLRSAAGMYWILDMEQEGVPYKKPLSLNEVGAGIYKMMEQGMEPIQIAEQLCSQYQVPRDMVLEDIEKFREQLRQFGIIL